MYGFTHLIRSKRSGAIASIIRAGSFYKHSDNLSDQTCEPLKRYRSNAVLG